MIVNDVDSQNTAPGGTSREDPTGITVEGVICGLLIRETILQCNILTGLTLGVPKVTLVESKEVLVLNDYNKHDGVCFVLFKI